MPRTSGSAPVVAPLRVRRPQAGPRAACGRILGGPPESQPSDPCGRLRRGARIVPERGPRMIDVRGAIEEIQARTGDEAYWRALEKVLGTLTARALRGTLRVKIQGE